MKNFKSTRHMLALLCLAVFGLFVQSCTRVEDVLEKTNVILDTDILNHVMSVQYVTPEGEEPELEVEIIGTDSDKILTVLGEKKVTADASMVNLAVRKLVDIDANNPIEFTLVVKAEGYLPSYRPYSIIEKNLDVRTVELVKADNPIEGVEKITQNVRRSANETIEFKNTKGDVATVNIAENTKMYAANGEEIQGNVRAEVIFTDANHADMNKIFPGGYTAKSDFDGASQQIDFQPIGLLSMDMYAGNKEVKTFSTPLEVNIPISSNTINPITEEAVKEGEELGVFSYDETTGDWTLESVATVSNVNGQLVASYAQNHLSFWVLGASGNPCGNRVRTNIFNYSIIYLISDIVGDPAANTKDIHANLTPYYVELLDVATGRSITPEGISVPIHNGHPIVLFAPPAKRVRLAVYDRKGGDILKLSGILNLCKTTNRVDVSDLIDPNLDPSLKINVAVAGRCADGLEVRPTLPVFFRPARGGGNPYDLLGVLESGVGSTTGLEIGRAYDFRIAIGGLIRECFNLVVPNEDTEIEIISPVYGFEFTVVVDYEFDENGDRVLNLTYLDIEVPVKACNEYKLYFLGE